MDHQPEADVAENVPEGDPGLRVAIVMILCSSRSFRLFTLIPSSIGFRSLAV